MSLRVLAQARLALRQNGLSPLRVAIAQRAASVPLPTHYSVARAFSISRPWLATEAVQVQHSPILDTTAQKPVKEKSSDDNAIPFSTIKDLISPETYEAITYKPYKLKNMTPVQAAVLKLLPQLAPHHTELQAGPDGRLPPRDLMVRAKTGTGKTLAFLIPAIEARLAAIERAKKQALEKAGLTRDSMYENRAVRAFTRTDAGALIISPTRELATQIANEALKLTHHHDGFEVRLFVGGNSKREQMRGWLRGRRDIVVATPGRLRDLLQSEPSIPEGLKNTPMLILDEADTLLDMGFRDDLEDIISYLPKSPERQTMLYSATVSRAIQQVARSTLDRNHEFINTVQEEESPVHAHIPQYHTVLPRAEDQVPHILRLLAHDQLTNPGKSKSVIFLPTTKMTQMYASLLRELARDTLPAGRETQIYEIHSRKDQDSRSRTSDRFRKDTSGASILVTSDVSARGVDYPGVTRVIQVGIPSSSDQYIHRVGRTGRAGTEGRGDLVLLPWEIGFVTWQLTHVPMKPTTVKQVEAEVLALAAKHDENPSAFYTPPPVPRAVRSRFKDSSRTPGPVSLSPRSLEKINQIGTIINETLLPNFVSKKMWFFKGVKTGPPGLQVCLKSLTSVKHSWRSWDTPTAVPSGLGLEGPSTLEGVARVTQNHPHGRFGEIKRTGIGTTRREDLAIVTGHSEIVAADSGTWIGTGIVATEIADVALEHARRVAGSVTGKTAVGLVTVVTAAGLMHGKTASQIAAEIAHAVQSLKTLIMRANLSVQGMGKNLVASQGCRLRQDVLRGPGLESDMEKEISFTTLTVAFQEPLHHSRNICIWVGEALDKTSSSRWGQPSYQVRVTWRPDDLHRSYSRYDSIIPSLVDLLRSHWLNLQSRNPHIPTSALTESQIRWQPLPDLVTAFDIILPGTCQYLQQSTGTGLSQFERPLIIILSSRFEEFGDLLVDITSDIWDEVTFSLRIVEVSTNPRPSRLLLATDRFAPQRSGNDESIRDVALDSNLIIVHVVGGPSDVVVPISEISTLSELKELVFQRLAYLPRRTAFRFQDTELNDDLKQLRAYGIVDQSIITLTTVVQVYVTTQQRSRVPVRVTMYAGVSSLKLLIRSKLDVPIREQILMCAGEELVDGTRLGSYPQVSHNSHIIVDVMPIGIDPRQTHELLCVCVKPEWAALDDDEEGDIYHVLPTSTILDLKVLVQNLNLISPSRQRIVFRGTTLEDEQNMNEAHVETGSTLILHVMSQRA
ncbi:RNA helicase [Rhizoctonia solani AG-1 IA]|uniref:ATP-dependent RNA helicase n=1 Tax=Thanatephorus cucumeris (strain AG1-IA) TaxID=983506 RepID=L8WTB2_THACA|nr:RNA helicase [Rhizoctonia solani AG-1 IA]